MVLITSDGGRDLADNQIPMGDTETGLVEEGGEMGASVPVPMPLGPYETAEKLHRSQAPSILGLDCVFGARRIHCMSQWGLNQTDCGVSGQKKPIFSAKPQGGSNSLRLWGVGEPLQHPPPLLWHMWHPAWPCPDLAGVHV